MSVEVELCGSGCTDMKHITIEMTNGIIASTSIVISTARILESPILKSDVITN